MKMTNAAAMQSLKVLAAANEKGRLGLAIARNRRLLQDGLAEYITRREELLLKYGEQKEDGVHIPVEQVQQFGEELSVYDNTEIEFSPYFVDENILCSGGLTSDDMFVLDWMVHDWRLDDQY